MTHDRYGDDTDERHLTIVQHHRCRRGWTGEDDEGRPIPCRICKPHLFRSES